MVSRRRLAFSVLTAWWAVCVAGAGTPLPTDPNVVRGKLENGLTYLIRKHATPPGKMALLLHVKTGSLDETDDERGLAHFLEHMAFNGSESFPANKVIEYFESIGMEFGDDLNAFTSFDQTVYMLFTPDAQPAQIDKAMLCLSDQAFRLLLSDEEIQKERGVILEESRARKNPQQRIRDKLYPRLFSGSRLANRMPIGDEKLIATFPRKAFVDHYRKWYRPENMTLILVGDADPVDQISLIKKNFGQHKPEGGVPAPLPGQIAAFTQPRAIVVSDPEIAKGEIEMINLAPGRPPVTDEEQFRVQLVEQIGSWLVERRFEEQVQKGQAGFREGNAMVSNFLNEVMLVGASVSGEPNQWARMLDEMIVTVNRARQHGFTARELEQARKELLANAERAAERESTRLAKSFLMEYNSSVNDRETILSAAQVLALYKKMLPDITLEEANATFAKNYAPGTFANVLTLPERDDLKLPSEEEVMAIAKAAVEKKTEPIVEEARPDSILAQLPSPGEIAQRSTDMDLGITTVRLENGIRVHHRFMDYRKDTVLVSITLDGGGIEETQANLGVSTVSALVFQQPATGRLTSTDVRDLTTGKKFTVKGAAEADGLTLSVSGSPKDMDPAFQLVHALLTDGKLEASAFDVWQKNRLDAIREGKTDPQYQMSKAIKEILSGHDVRLRMLSEEQVQRQRPDEGQKWFDRLRAEAPIEVAVVGEIELDKALELVSRYLGSLPARPAASERLDALRTVERDPGPHVRTVKVETLEPTALVFCGFLGCEESAVSDVRVLALVSNILTTRMVKDIREAKQLVYGIRATNQPSRAYRESGLFYAWAKTDPEKADRLAEELITALADFAKNGPTEEELNVAKKQIANNLDTERKEPAHWLNVLADLEYHHKSLKDFKEEEAAYQAVTLDEVRATFNKYHRPERMVRVVVLPSAPPASSQPAGSQPTSRPASQPAATTQSR